MKNNISQLSEENELGLLRIKLSRGRGEISITSQKPEAIPEKLKDNINKITTPELKKLCDSWGISRIGKSKIADLVLCIQDHFSEKDTASNYVPDSDSVPDSEIFQLPTKKKKPLTFIDLFAGIGGFHQALSNLGFECVFASEINSYAKKVYEDNYKMKVHGDITKVEITKIPTFEILCAGFPCQPFSKAGRQDGFKDTRGNLFYNICKIVQHHKPKYLILENVRNLASHDNGNTWKTIKKNIKELGYLTFETPVILNTLYFGIPQSRERVVIMCKRNDIGSLPKLPTISKKLIKKTSLLNIMEPFNQINEKYKISEKLKQTEKVWGEFINILNDNKIDVPKFPIWTDWWDSDGIGTSVMKIDTKKTKEDNQKEIKKIQGLFYKKYKNWIDKNRKFYKDNLGIMEPWLTDARTSNPLWKGAVRKFEWQTGDIRSFSETLWSPRGSGVRVKKINYSPTLVAMASMIPIYGKESRYLTPRECARLQSFPDSFVIDKNDKEAYKQFGNAVNVKMIERCADFLVNNKPLL
jgi:DNA (cytosine-5)-methyltransferase 1